jgi:flagellar hook-associated protein 1
MGLNSVLEIGKSGLNIYQMATEVTSQNIANINTAGYSRQQVVLETAPPTTANGFPLGTGVRIASISRSYDALIQQQLVNAQTTQGYDTTKSNVLQQIEPSFNEVANDGLGAAVSKYFGAWQDLSLNPSGQTERQSLLTNAQILTDNFHSVSKTLTDTITSQNNALVPLTNSINATLNNIAQLNSQIKTTQMVSGNANELKDQRDQLIQNLSQQMGIKYTENSDGTTDVYVTDNSASPAVNYNLVKGSIAGSVNADTTNPNKTVITVTDNSGALPATSNPLDPAAATPFYTSDTSGGQLWATLKMRDVTVPGYLSKLDSLATTIATQVNTQQQAGSDLTGSIPPATVAFFDPATSSAATFNINPALTSTSQIAAAANGAPTGDNSNALQIANLQNTLTMSGNTTTFNSYYDSLVSTVGLDVQSSKNTVTQDAAFTQQITNLQQSNSGVSLDEELTNLMKYQRSYQASAKLITTATEMMDTVMGLIQ